MLLRLLFQEYIEPHLVLFLERHGIKQPVYRLGNIFLGLMFLSCSLLVFSMPIGKILLCDTATRNCSFKTHYFIRDTEAFEFQFSDVTGIYPDRVVERKGNRTYLVGINAKGQSFYAYIANSRKDALRVTQKLQSYLDSPKESSLKLDSSLPWVWIPILGGVALLWAAYFYIKRGLLTACKTFHPRLKDPRVTVWP